MPEGLARGGAAVPCRAVRPTEEWVTKEVDKLAALAAKKRLERERLRALAELRGAKDRLRDAEAAVAAALCASGVGGRRAHTRDTQAHSMHLPRAPPHL